jgi:hypothetical protein
LPAHVHGQYAGTIVIIDLLADGSIQQSEREDAIGPKNAKRSDVRKILNVAAKQATELHQLWEKCMDQHPNDRTTDEQIDAALERARNAPEPQRIVEARYHRDLELFELKISDGRRLVLPREQLQFVASATQEQAADFTTEPRGVHMWWPQLDEGFSLRGLLEGRMGNEKWMERLQRPVAA